MRAWNPRAWQTWRGQSSAEPSVSDCAESCHRNAEEAAREEGQLRALFERLPPGDSRLLGVDGKPSLRERIVQARCEQRHWRDMARWYEQRGGARRDREPGEDDDSNEHWSETQREVR